MKLRKLSAVVVLTLAGTLTVMSTASAQALPHAETLAIYDSTGKRVGTLTNSGGVMAQVAEVVLRTASGHSLFLDVRPSGLEGISPFLSYAELGCAGPPYLHRGSESGRQPTSFLLGPRQQVYVQVPRTAPQ